MFWSTGCALEINIYFRHNFSVYNKKVRRVRMRHSMGKKESL
jgi:hypothetical protein